MTTSPKTPAAGKSAGKSTSTRSRTAKSTASGTRKGTSYKAPANAKADGVTAATPATAPATEAAFAPAASPVATASAVVTETQPAVIRPDMKKRELLTEVVTRSGIKKRDAKPAIEAALAILGEALADGRELNLPPLGKVKINRIKKSARGQVIVAKVRQISAAPDSTPEDTSDPLAQAAE